MLSFPLRTLFSCELWSLVMNEKHFSLPDRMPMFAAIGHGITAFAAVEFGVGMCFATMLYPAPREYSVAVINSARSFEAKKKMIDALAMVALVESDLKKWRKLSSIITRRKYMRDKLAHWMVSNYPGIQSAKDFDKQKIGLVPPIFYKMHFAAIYDPSGNHGSNPIQLDDINCYIKLTNDLVMGLANFQSEVRPIKKNANN